MRNKIVFSAFILFSVYISACGAAALRTTASYTRTVNVEVDYSTNTREMLNPYTQVDNLIETTLPEDDIQTPYFRSLDQDISLPSGRQTLRSMLLLRVSWSGDVVYDDYAIYEMAQMGLRPATALETLFFLEHSGYVLESANVVALGSFWGDCTNGRRVMVAGRNHGDDVLRLRHVGEGFLSNSLFLAVPIRQQ